VEIDPVKDEDGKVFDVKLAPYREKSPGMKGPIIEITGTGLPTGTFVVAMTKNGFMAKIDPATMQVIKGSVFEHASTGWRLIKSSGKTKAPQFFGGQPQGRSQPVPNSNRYYGAAPIPMDPDRPMPAQRVPTSMDSNQMRRAPVPPAAFQSGQNQFQRQQTEDFGKQSAWDRGGGNMGRQPGRTGTEVNNFGNPPRGRTTAGNNFGNQSGRDPRGDNRTGKKSSSCCCCCGDDENEQPARYNDPAMAQRQKRESESGCFGGCCGGSSSPGAYNDPRTSSKQMKKAEKERKKDESGCFGGCCGGSSSSGAYNDPSTSSKQMRKAEKERRKSESGCFGGCCGSSSNDGGYGDSRATSNQMRQAEKQRKESESGCCGGCCSLLRRRNEESGRRKREKGVKRR
jgi:hypothetical protein